MTHLFRMCFLAAVSAALLCPVLASEPWRGRFVGEDLRANLVIDLYEESVEVPDMEMFGPMHGYLNGSDVYRMWYVTRAEITDSLHARIRVSNDLGSEAQAIELSFSNDSTLVMRLVDGISIKRVVKSKLQRLPEYVTLHRKRQ